MQLPRLTNDQIKAMTNVPTGMLLFSTTDSVLYTCEKILAFRSEAAKTDRPGKGRK